MTISIALAGKPNSGKSTFFKAATLANVEIANYPFTTIDANHGVGYVRTPHALAGNLNSIAGIAGKGSGSYPSK